MSTSKLIVIGFTCDAPLDADEQERYGVSDTCLAEFKVDNDGWTNLTVASAKQQARDAGWTFGTRDAARCMMHRRKASDAWRRA